MFENTGKILMDAGAKENAGAPAEPISAPVSPARSPDQSPARRMGSPSCSPRSPGGARSARSRSPGSPSARSAHSGGGSDSAYDHSPSRQFLLKAAAPDDPDIVGPSPPQPDGTKEFERTLG